jgi:hypothetical protein
MLIWRDRLIQVRWNLNGRDQANDAVLCGPVTSFLLWLRSLKWADQMFVYSMYGICTQKSLWWKRHIKSQFDYLTYKIEIVCMFAYNPRTDAPICTKLGMHIPWDQEKVSERSKLRKSVLGSKPDEGGFCISETKNSGRTSPRSKLFRWGCYRNNGRNPGNCSEFESRWRWFL